MCRPVPMLACTSVLLVGATVASAQLPDHVLVGYWHNWVDPSPLRIIDVPDAYDVVNVAFALPTMPSGATMTFSPTPDIYPDPALFLSDVAALQTRGRRVVISIGGANHPVVVDSPEDAAAFTASMLGIITTYGFDGLDIDLEGSSLLLDAGDTDFSSPTSPRIVHFIAAVEALLDQLPADFMLTAAPETAFVQGGHGSYGGVWGAYLPVLDALRDRMTFVQVQHYNTGTMFGRDGVIYTPATADFHVAMADALLGGFPVAFGAGGFFEPLRPDQVVIGLPAIPSAAGSGHTDATTVQQALTYLYTGQGFGGGYQLADPSGYPCFRGLMTWSINWDLHAGTPFSGPHRAFLDGLGSCTSSCPGDVNGDGATDTADLSVLIGSFGSSVAPGIGGDLNGDGVVDAADLSVVVGGFGCGG